MIARSCKRLSPDGLLRSFDLEDSIVACPLCDGIGAAAVGA